eukprot:CAMPEP_0202857246 /NCGR_PEP_ID=MMETSP1391-20130828/264_1 /ASSEMBLY_ACC=CAM_ASM_000867 /TAXON_ID=1034604 /ORGANISM="Chlamydomonas leiostraca, Strain SAG 11-49" /LENGTH=92 /DNA_ID=CAMNT_0049536029 /DNA_START=205 /DNA_END=483 /DNA_ORIENTATION=-
MAYAARPLRGEEDNSIAMRDLLAGSTVEEGFVDSGSDVDSGSVVDYGEDSGSTIDEGSYVPDNGSDPDNGSTDFGSDPSGDAGFDQGMSGPL